MSFEITFPGGTAVEARYGQFTIRSDQPAANGGDDSAPSPFALFLASVGNCAGYYALRFCQQRNLDVSGMRLILEAEQDPQRHRLKTIHLTLELPADFPEKYQAAVLRATDQCAVKRAILDPPEFVVRAVLPSAHRGG